MSNSKLSVLVAEDNPALANVLRFNLQRVNLDVSLANDGCRAWEMAQKQRFDLVVTDQEMPGMTGLELCQRLRERAEYADVRIVMVTAREMELDIMRLKEQLQIEAVFSKPYSPNQLLDVVQELLAQA